LEDLAAPDVISRAYADADLRVRAGGKTRYKMRELEAELMRKILPKLSGDCWLVADGSLMFQPILQSLTEFGETIPPVLGVSKNFRKDPQFVFGRGPRAERFSIYSLLANLEHEHRTAVFSAYGGQVAFLVCSAATARCSGLPADGRGQMRVGHAEPRTHPDGVG
jgi:hypothetical protein